MVSMARPFLADPEFVNKASLEKSQLIAPCIACNQDVLITPSKDKLVHAWLTREHVLKEN